MVDIEHTNNVVDAESDAEELEMECIDWYLEYSKHHFRW
jgi:hypothetical protein